MSKYVFGFRGIGWCPIEFDSREEVMLAGDKHKYRSGRDLYVGEKHLCWPEIDIDKIFVNIKAVGRRKKGIQAVPYSIQPCR